jgi:hypothetical protein
VTHRLISNLSPAPITPCASGVILRTTISCFYVSEVKETETLWNLLHVCLTKPRHGKYLQKIKFAWFIKTFPALH